MPLTPQQLVFVELYCDPEAETWGNALQSCRRAGYSPNGIRGASHKLMRNPAVRRAINQRVRERVAESIFSPDVIRANLLRLARKSEERGDFPTAARSWEGIARSIGLFSYKLIASVEEPGRETVIDAATREEAGRLAALRLDTTGGPGPVEGRRALGPGVQAELDEAELDRQVLEVLGGPEPEDLDGAGGPDLEGDPEAGPDRPDPAGLALDDAGAAV